MVEGLSHLTFIVADLDRMTRFLTEILDAKEVYSSGTETFSLSEEKFFLVGGIWVAVMEGEPLSEMTYNHVAFKIPEEEYERYVRRVRSFGVDVREGRSRVKGEGRSVYFYDYDGHFFELHTGTLEERLRRYERGA
jgi:fosfomycin resistance protein FosX